MKAKKQIELDYANLGFSYTKTPFNVRCYYKDGKWGRIQVSDDENISMHIASTALHYGQQCFEGLKAQRGADGKVRVFRVEDNARRMMDSAEYLQMAQPPVELFCKAVEEVVKLNIEYVPPFGSGGSLYIRPVLFGVGAIVGIKPAQEYALVIFVTPVGQYFSSDGGGIKTIVDRQHDRSGAHGTGHIKAGGNYASSLKSGVEIHDKGYSSAIYLDPIEHRYIDECGAANFFGIKDNTYVTPISSSILPSITNRTLMQISEDMGLKVERRRIDLAAEGSSFSECGACGTAAVISPIASILDPENNTTHTFQGAGPVINELLKRYKAIQLGEAEDTHNWNTIISEE